MSLENGYDRCGREQSGAPFTTVECSKSSASDFGSRSGPPHHFRIHGHPEDGYGSPIDRPVPKGLDHSIIDQTHLHALGKGWGN
jgi:hypothetical protein